ncbi:MAG TPA: GNAT family N-acetyltransferase [Planktothrix sp.]|jgi:ribosomal protein S18 acetylase RimI-like enzyme
MHAKTAVPSAVTLRQLKRGDRDAVLAIEQDGFPTSTLHFTFYDHLEDADSFGIVAVEEKRVLAYMLYEDVDDQIYLSELAVAKQARRRGIGRMLVTWLIEQLPQYRRDRIELDVFKENANAIALYRSLGFKPAPELSGRRTMTMQYKRQSTARRRKKRLST